MAKTRASQQTAPAEVIPTVPNAPFQGAANARPLPPPHQLQSHLQQHLMKPLATATAAVAPVTASTALPVDPRRRGAAGSAPAATSSGSSTAVSASIIPAAVAAPTMPTTTPPSTSAYNLIAPPPPPPTAPPTAAEILSNVSKNTLFHPKFFQLTIIHVSEYCKNIGIVIYICSACRNTERSQESCPSLSVS